MKKYLAFILCMVMALGMTLTGCDSSSDTLNLSSEGNSAAASQNDQTSYPSSDVTELVVRFGDDGAPFTMYLEDNSTAAAIAGYVGTTEWRLPVYSYDESNVVEYYDIPSSCRRCLLLRSQPHCSVLPRCVGECRIYKSRNL